MINSTLTIHPGADFAYTAVLPNGNGGAADLTGFTASIADETGLLAGAVTVSLPNPALGQVRIAVTWQAGWALIGQVLGQCRIRLTSGAQDNATNLLTISVVENASNLIINRSADFACDFTWPDDSEGVSLVGQIVETYNASSGLAGRVSVTVLDAVARKCRLSIEGVPGMSVGVVGSFQMRRSTAGSIRRTTNVQRVILQ